MKSVKYVQVYLGYTHKHKYYNVEKQIPETGVLTP